MPSSHMPVSKSGAAVMTLMAPAEVFLPNSVPCGPRRISTRSSVGQVGERRAGAGAIDAVDEDADRGFKAGVVRAGADAADARRWCRRCCDWPEPMRSVGATWRQVD